MIHTIQVSLSNRAPSVFRTILIISFNHFELLMCKKHIRIKLVASFV